MAFYKADDIPGRNTIIDPTIGYGLQIEAEEVASFSSVLDYLKKILKIHQFLFRYFAVAKPYALVSPSA